jgi:TetR/AcrR family acrAB operon transcriptional repressor
MTNQQTLARKARKELLSEWRHHEILEAARRIFARLSYAATNVEEIAKEAGTAKGTVYLYFKSKEEILAAVLASDLECLVDKTIAGMSTPKTFAERLTVFLNLRSDYLQHNQDFLRICFDEFGSRCSRSKLISEVIDKPFKRGFDFMRRCLEQAIAQGELRAIPVEPAALAIFDLARGFLERHLRGWAQLSLEEDVAFTHSLILYGLHNK